MREPRMFLTFVALHLSILEFQVFVGVRFELPYISPERGFTMTSTSLGMLASLHQRSLAYGTYGTWTKAH